MADFEDIKKAFRKAVDSDAEVRKIYADLQDLPTYANAMKLANKIGEDLGKVLVKFAPELSVDDLELADILPKALGLDHAQVTTACKQVQESMNKQAGLGIKYKEPQFNMDKALGLADEVRGITDECELSQALVERVKNFSESVVDDSIHDNASVIANAGVKAYIVRTAEANCCDWCNEVAGTYDYFDVKDKGNDVWRRHLGCQCDIEFILDRNGTYDAKRVYNFKEKERNTVDSTIGETTATSSKQSKPTIPDSVRKNYDEFEKKYVNAPTEHGALYSKNGELISESSSKRGDSVSIATESVYQDMGNGSYEIHNHTAEELFSWKDIQNYEKYGINGTITIPSGYEYSLFNSNEPMWNWSDDEKLKHDWLATAWGDATEKINEQWLIDRRVYVDSLGDYDRATQRELVKKWDEKNSRIKRQEEWLSENADKYGFVFEKREI